MLKENTLRENEKKYLTCEKTIIFVLLMMTSGMMGAYTVCLRGEVFCNAQTANFVLMAVALGNMQWMKGLYYLIPMSAYLAGAIISEILPGHVKKINLLRWDTYLIGFEMIVLFIIGFIPLSLPDQIAQVMINFICSMQYNTFRQAQGTPMATTFCTNHLRQTGVWLVKFCKKRDITYLQRCKKHIIMLASFFFGGIISTVGGRFLQEKAIWLALVPLFINFILLSYADLTSEHDLLQQVPSGH
ncbi:YoaK family protein [Anaerosporobacter sp.]